MINNDSFFKSTKQFNELEKEAVYDRAIRVINNARACMVRARDNILLI